MILRIIGFVGAISGLYGFLVPPSFPNQQMIAAAVGILLFILYAGAEIYSFFSSKDFVCKESDATKINKKMLEIISQEGRTTILSRDLSWAHSPEIQRKLAEKAQRKELTVHLEAPTNFSNQLHEKGAKVVYYGPTGFVPESRFTMMNVGQPHAKIAIGFVRDGNRVIRYARNGEEASFHLADDLLKALTAAVGATNA